MTHDCRRLGRLWAQLKTIGAKHYRRRAGVHCGRGFVHLVSLLPARDKTRQKRARLREEPQNLYSTCYWGLIESACGTEPNNSGRELASFRNGACQDSGT